MNPFMSSGAAQAKLEAKEAELVGVLRELVTLRAQIADLKMSEVFTSNTMVVLKDTIADLELQHVGDKAIIEALNERVGELTQQLDKLTRPIEMDPMPEGGE